jgi:hypothetical protein
MDGSRTIPNIGREITADPDFMKAKMVMAEVKDSMESHTDTRENMETIEVKDSMEKSHTDTRKKMDTTEVKDLTEANDIHTRKNILIRKAKRTDERVKNIEGRAMQKMAGTDLMKRLDMQDDISLRLFTSASYDAHLELVRSCWHLGIGGL